MSRCTWDRVPGVRGWTPPWQQKTKVKFRGCQHTGCWICSVVISKPPSKLYFGFRIVMIFARQPPGTRQPPAMTASWQPLDSHLTATRKFPSVPILGIFVSMLVFWFVDSRKCVWAKKKNLDSLLTAWQHWAFWQPGGVHPLIMSTKFGDFTRNIDRVMKSNVPKLAATLNNCSRKYYYIRFSRLRSATRMITHDSFRSLLLSAFCNLRLISTRQSRISWSKISLFAYRPHCKPVAYYHNMTAPTSYSSASKISLR